MVTMLHLKYAGRFNCAHILAARVVFASLYLDHRIGAKTDEIRRKTRRSDDQAPH
jgi:hypothetical protein